MKVKFLLTAAIAASMALVSCNKEQAPVPTDNQPKSVTVKLPNIMPTKATGDAVADGSQVALTDYTVFFTDAAGNVLDVPEYNDMPQTVYFDSTTEIGKAYTYHFLPANTENVVVVGNLGDVSKAYTTEAQLEKVMNVLNDNHDGQGAVALYPLYGKSGLTQAAGLDEEDHTPLYTATVNLTPRVSRFEVYAFGYNSEPGQAASSAYESVKLDKIALNNYYTQYNFVAATPSGSPVNAPITDENAWSWMETTSAPWADELDITLTAGEHLLSNGSALTGHEDGEGATGIVTYGIVSNAGGQLPQLVLTLTGTKSGVETPLYLVGNFSKTTFEAGKIYRVDFVFADADFEQPERCVELTVTVANWEVVPVTPEF